MSAIAYSYIRFSTTEQRRGDSLRRQTKAGADWCQRNNVRMDTGITFRDLGRSAFLGDHRKNPDRHALAAFLKLVEEGKIPRGSYLIIESLDRLTREHVRAGLMLLLGLIEAGVRIVQLSPSELIYDENADEMSLMLAIVELSRGHRESKRKSDLSGPAWARKKQGAKEGRIVTERLPAWVTVEGDKLALIPENAEAVRTVFKLAANGYGTPTIVGKLNRDNVPPIGKTGQWNRAYVGIILRDRRAVGEYQPRKGKKRLPDGEPVPNYFPAVVTEQEFFAARAGAAERGEYHGRKGATITNIFAGLLKHARDGDAYFMTHRVEGKNRDKRNFVLIASGSDKNGKPCYSFPYRIFEEAILGKLAEINPADIVGGADSENEVAIIAGELSTVEEKITALESELEDGASPTLFKVVRKLEERKAALAKKLIEARAKAANPLADSWADCRSLRAVLANAKDSEDVRLRLRSALRRIVDEIHLLVVARKMVRLAAVRVQFKGGESRSYFIYHRPGHHSFAGFKEGDSWAAALDTVAKGSIDLRDKQTVKRVEKFLTELDLDELPG